MLNRRRLPATAAAAPAAWSQTRRPNVLVILSDDQGYGDFSAHGNPVLKTPNMEQAGLRAGRHHLSAKAAPEAKQVSFRVRLAAGRTPLDAWFQDAGGQDLAGAFSARLRRLG